MRKYYKVISYNPSEMYHYCLDENFKEHRIDFMFNENPESIVGRFVSVKNLFPYMELSIEPVLLDIGEIPNSFNKELDISHE